MTKTHPARPAPPYEAILMVALVGQLLLAGASLTNSLAGFCGSCGKGSPVHASIAGVGLLGYGVLILLHHKRRRTWVERGVFAAFATHIALMGVMGGYGYFCGLCVLAAVGSGIAMIAVVATSENVPRLIVRVLMPVFVGASLLSWTVVGIEHLKYNMRSQDAVTELGSPRHAATSTLNVWVSPSCPYCRDFTTTWAPQLRKDFPELEIVYHAAESASWLKWKPTIALGTTILFEGLPEEYDDLRYEIQIRTTAQTVLN